MQIEQQQIWESAEHNITSYEFKTRLRSENA